MAAKTAKAGAATRGQVQRMDRKLYEKHFFAHLRGIQHNIEMGAAKIGEPSDDDGCAPIERP